MRKLHSNATQTAGALAFVRNLVSVPTSLGRHLETAKPIQIETPPPFFFIFTFVFIRKQKTQSPDWKVKKRKKQRFSFFGVSPEFSASLVPF